MFLNTLAAHSDFFHKAIPQVPMGRYVHFVVLRETNSFPLFQTDQQLNFAVVSAGRGNQAAPISRIVLFKRKQTTPERLTGRELLRRYNLISEQNGTTNYCEYNSEDFCKTCPDCILYGFAIGNAGSERSKVLVDSAFSLSNYDESHQAMTFNAPYEHGTMSKAGETRSSFGEQDHVLPQVFFPTVITLRDATEAGFIYVLNNILRTKRYGAQTTRTGTLENHLVGVVLADGEIFSNLKLTQTLYDALDKDEAGQIKKGPYSATDLVGKIGGSLNSLLKEDRVAVHHSFMGEELANVLAEVDGLITDEAKLTEVLRQAYTESQSYAETFGAKVPKKGKGKATENKE